MERFVRRSHLLVAANDVEAVQSSWTHNADAVILDLGDGVPDHDKPHSRSLIKESLVVASKGAAEVFVRIDKRFVHADIEASVWPGLNGIVYSGAESGTDIEQAHAFLTEMERSRGVELGSLQIIVLLDSGKGVWNIREIIKASPRVCSVGLDEMGMCESLGIVPDADFDPFVYAKGRIVVEGRAAKVQPIGISHPYGVLPRFDDQDAIYDLALRGKNLGFAGTICPHSSWVEPCNRAHTPPEDRLEFYKETRRLFAEGIAQGTAAIPYPGTTMMIDVPVDERARVTLELSELCAARDAEKAEAIRIHGLLNSA